MTTFTDTLLFIVGGVTQASNSGDTISISRNLTIVSPSTFTLGVNATFLTGTSSPTISQANNTTASATGQALTIQAQNATGTTSVGGNLVLTSGTGTSINGFVQLQSGGTTVAQVSSNQFAVLKGLNQHVTAITANYGVLITDIIIAVGTISGGITVTLPSSPTTGDTYLIKDTNGLSATFNITVAGNGHTIDGFTNYIIANNYASMAISYTGSQWSVMIKLYFGE